MLSYLTLVNKVLRRLREQPVTTVNQTTYSTLVGQFINDAKREVEDSWQWSELLTSFNVTTTANSSAPIPWPTTVSPRARLAVDPRTNNGISAMMAPAVSRMEVANINTYLMERLSADLSPHYGTPTALTQVRNPAALAIENRNPWSWSLWPYPDAVYTITAYIIDPQTDLVNDTDILLVPAAPVEMRAYLYLLYERGEEMGEYLGIVANKAESALADAVALDQIQNWAQIEFHV